MAKSPKRRSSTSKKSPSRSPRSKESSVKRTHARKASRSRSASRSTHGTRSRSSSRSRVSPSKKRTISPVMKKFDESAAVVRRVIPLQRSSGDSGYKFTPFSSGGAVRRHPITMRVLNVNNLKVKGTKLKHRLTVHCKQFTRFYILLLVLALIALGIFYAGYTLDQMAKNARQRMDAIVAYIQSRG